MNLYALVHLLYITSDYSSRPSLLDPTMLMMMMMLMMRMLE